MRCTFAVLQDLYCCSVAFTLLQTVDELSVVVHAEALRNIQHVTIAIFRCAQAAHVAELLFRYAATVKQSLQHLFVYCQHPHQIRKVVSQGFAYSFIKRPLVANFVVCKHQNCIKFQALRHVLYPCLKNPDPTTFRNYLPKADFISDFRSTWSLFILPTACGWKVWYGSRTTCVVSIETVAPFAG